MKALILSLMFGFCIYSSLWGSRALMGIGNVVGEMKVESEMRGASIMGIRREKTWLWRRRSSCSSGVRGWNFNFGILNSIVFNSKGVNKWVMWESCRINSSGSSCGRADVEAPFKKCRMTILYFNLIHAACAFRLPPKQISLVI